MRNQKQRSCICTLDGRKVDDSRSLPQGLYIIDGKKVVK